MVSVVDSLGEVSIEVTNVASIRVVGISVVAIDLIEFEILWKTVGNIVDSSASIIELVVNVDEVCGVVDISGKIDVLMSLSSVDENISSTSMEVLEMTLLALVDVAIVV